MAITASEKRAVGKKISSRPTATEVTSGGRRGPMLEPAGASLKKAPKRAKPATVAELHLFDFIDVYQAAPMERIEWIKKGVGAINVVDLADRLDTSKEQLMKALGLPRATIDRKAKAYQNLSTEQAERLIGLSKLIGQVETMVEQSGEPAGFDAAHWVGRWLDRPNPSLGGRRPAELMDTVAGQEVVSSVLAKLQSGAYA